MKRILPLLLIPVTLFGAGCATSSGSPAPGLTVKSVSAAPDACKLYLQSDAETLFGGAKSKQDTPTLAQADVPRTECSFSVEGEHFADLQSSNLIVRDNPDVEYAKRNMENLKSSYVKDLKGQNIPVSGLGDDAFWGGVDLNQIVVRKGSTVLLLTAIGEKIHSKTADEQLKIMTETMKKIMSRL